MTTIKINDLDRDRLKHKLNNEVVKRILIKYFVEHGYIDTFELPINPIKTQDIVEAHPALDTKLEIVPYVVSIDPTTNRATIGWNLFVLGNQRMFLGETIHGDLRALAAQIRMGPITEGSMMGTRRCTTPLRIITFIDRCLSSSEYGYVDLSITQQTRQPRLARPTGLSTSMAGQPYGRASNGGV